ncbi:MAG: hypothetical protein WCF18_12210 [Chthoniobacteraceae bacterium]
MNPRFHCLLATLCVAAACLSSCTLFEPGGPSAAITVKARSAFNVTDVVERVFVDEGYQTILRTGDGVTFERKATKTDQVLYGDWNEGEVTQRAKVTIASNGEELYRVRCIPYVVRDPHDVSFEDQHRRMQLYSFHYSKLLKEVRKQCDELWFSREPAASGEPAASN